MTRHLTNEYVDGLWEGLGTGASGVCGTLRQRAVSGSEIRLAQRVSRALSSLFC